AESAATSEPSFLASLRESCRQLGCERQRLLVGVSGGPDSVGLFWGLCELRTELHLELSAAHVHHGWRGAEADADADFVSQLAQRLGVPTEVLHIAPERKSELAGKSLEEGARDARYELLTAAAQRQRCALLAVGHTADDQVETVLHHILRGT